MGFSSALVLTAVSLLAPPDQGAVDRRVKLLAELATITELECSGHDELIGRFDRALELVDADGGDAAVRLQIGRLNALLLQRVQTGRGETISAISAAALRLHGPAAASAEVVGELQTLASKVAAVLDGGSPEPCAEPEPEPEPEPLAAPPPTLPADPPRDPMGPTLPADAGPPAPEAPKRWTNTEIGLVGSGAALCVGGLASVLTGVIGPIAARSNPKVKDDDAGQQAFLDETVPRNATIAFSIGGAALSIGVGLVVTGLVVRRRRRGATRMSGLRPARGWGSAARGHHGGLRPSAITATETWVPVLVR